MFSPLIIFCLTFRIVWLWMIVFVSMIYFNKVSIPKTITAVALNTFLNVLLIFHIYQCLLIISLIFCKVLYVTVNYVFLYCISFVEQNLSLQIVYLFDLVSKFSLCPFSMDPFSQPDRNYLKLPENIAWYKSFKIT